MKLTKDAVRHVAKLANLPLSSEEEEKYSQQLSKILDYIDQLNQVETEGLEPTFNVSGQEHIMRSDEIGECLNQDGALANAPQKKKGFFVTKGIFDNE